MQAVALSDIPTLVEDFSLSKAAAQKQLKGWVDQLSSLQQRLFAEQSRALLLIFQGMDASGKDSTIRRVTTGVNPAGVHVQSYGVPTTDDLAQSYFQRHFRDLPAYGQIGVHNRSHYEEVVVTRVHPDYLRLRGIDTDEVNERFWMSRFEDIRNFERLITRRDRTTIIKFFLHISKEEQRNRLLERLDEPTKNWKFADSDIRDRAYWNDYQLAYESAIAATSTEYAPWYVIPADQKRFARLAVAEIVVRALETLDPQFPPAETNLEQAKQALLKT